MRYVRRLLPGCQDPVGIVQEALLRTCEHAQDVLEPRTYAFAMARSLAADSRRYTRSAKTDSLGDLSASSVVSSGVSHEGKTLGKEEGGCRGKRPRSSVHSVAPPSY